jgi:hypothetical protein
MNFTWFASAYDCDDVAYRLLAFAIMAGSLLIAAGISTAAIPAPLPVTVEPFAR